MKFSSLPVMALSALVLLQSGRNVAADTIPTSQPAMTEAQYAAQFPPISITPGEFSADPDSFEQYQYPQWFRDAKLGIWSHWGPQSVPMEGDWYARKMYEAGSSDFKDHLARYGHPSQAGYKDIIPLWKAERWDPDALMALYKKAGARYFVAQAVHHDNFDNWNSKYHRWNSVNMGPHRDIVGDWQKAAVKFGLPFGVSEHLGASYTWFQASHGSDKTGPLAGVLYDGANPALFDLYHYPAAADDKSWYSKDPLWQQEWFARVKDVVDQYHPQLLYSDGSVPFNNEVGLSMIAHLYNSSAAQNGGVVQAVYNCKQDSKGMWVEDLERGVMAGIRPYPWQTDTSIGDWFYNKHWKYRSAEWVIHSLVDIVSKNGNLLINVVQRPDGTLDDDATKIVNNLAEWISINGEGIYQTRPWLVYGEGKAHSKGGSFQEDNVYGAEDIRFTSKGDNLMYAFVLGWPAYPNVVIRSLGKYKGVTGTIERVSLLGHDGDVKWNDAENGLTVTLPGAKPADFAVCLKIEGQNLRGFKPESAQPDTTVVKADAAGQFLLIPEAAELTGSLKEETRGGTQNIGFWDKAADSASWTLSTDQPGKYTVTANYACADNSAINVGLGNSKTALSCPATGGWDQFEEISAGTIYLKMVGTQRVTIAPADPKAWKPINLRWIKLVKLPR